jgi:hypothetical protein
MARGKPRWDGCVSIHSWCAPRLGRAVYRLMLAVRDAIPQTGPLAKAESAPSMSI